MQPPVPTREVEMLCAAGVGARPLPLGPAGRGAVLRVLWAVWWLVCCHELPAWGSPKQDVLLKCYHKASLLWAAGWTQPGLLQVFLN